MAADGTDAAFDDEVEPTVTIREYMDGIEAEELVTPRYPAHPPFFSSRSGSALSPVCLKP
jgi:hypothetical protein